MKLSTLLAALSLSTLSLQAQAQVKVAVFSLNDFHAGFVRDSKGIPGAPAVKQTLDSLKRVYPYHVTVAAGDNFGGSYFYNATHGALLPVFFNDLGIRISALGNHEFDDGQRRLAAKWENSPLRPAQWDLTYVASNVRNVKEGCIPDFCQPVATETIELPNGKKFRIAFTGLIASSTPQQASKRKLGGLDFDGNYPAVLDSVMKLPEASLITDANLRLLLTHIGSRMNENGQPVWDDKDAIRLSQLNDPTWDGVLSAHSHKEVKGYINEARYPIVQGGWHGEHIAMLLCTVDPNTMRVTAIEPQLIKVTPKQVLEKESARLQTQIDSLLQYTRTEGGTPLGEVLTYSAHPMEHDRNYKFRQTEVGSLICQAFAHAYRQAAKLDPNTVVIGCSHFGSIRAGLPQGKITVLDVGEALPFANSLKVYQLTGEQLMKLVNFGKNNRRYGYLQIDPLKVVQNANNQVTALIYQSPDGKQCVLQPKKKYYLVTDEFITTGGDGYSPEFFPPQQEVKTSGMPATTDAFINYLRGRKL